MVEGIEEFYQQIADSMVEAIPEERSAAFNDLTSPNLSANAR